MHNICSKADLLLWNTPWSSPSLSSMHVLNFKTRILDQILGLAFFKSHLKIRLVCQWLWSIYDNILTTIKLKYLKKTFSCTNLCTTNPKWTALGLHSGLCSKMSVTNHLSPSIANSAYWCLLLITGSVFSILI
jgi:hypothetical protein